MDFSQMRRAARRFAVIAIAGVGLAGCYDVDATITFRNDGTAAATSQFGFPRDAEYVFKFYQAILELQPATAKFAEKGLCPSIEHLGANVKPQPIDIQGREYTTEDRFGCGFLMELGDSAAVIDRLKQAQQANVLTLEDMGPQRVKISLDFNNVPDFAHVMPGLVLLGAMKYGQGVPNMAAVQKLADASADATLAMARMSAANNHIQFAIKARKVIETNGAQEGDLVRFRWSVVDFTRLMVKRAKGDPEAKVFYAVIEY